MHEIIWCIFLCYTHMADSHCPNWTILKNREKIMILLKKKLLTIFLLVIQLIQKLKEERVLTAKVLIEISNLYNVSVDYLLGLTNFPKRIQRYKKK